MTNADSRTYIKQVVLDYVSERFDWDKVTEKTVGLYQRRTYIDGN